MVLAVVGLCLVLSAVGVATFVAGFSPAWLAVIVGVCLIGAGIYIIRGGNITL